MQYWHLTAHFIIMDWPTPYRIIIMSQRPKVIEKLKMYGWNYNEERLLIELIRNKRKFSFDLYKEIIRNYRKLIHKMDMTQIMEYAYELPKTNMVMETIRLEIL